MTCTKEWPAFKERTLALAERLEKVLKKEDATRKSVMAFNMTNVYNEIGLNLVDVVGWNLYHGLYEGELNGFDRWCEDQYKNYPRKPMIISEWGAGSGTFRQWQELWKEECRKLPCSL